jgi:hypothetical protein
MTGGQMVQGGQQREVLYSTARMSVSTGCDVVERTMLPRNHRIRFLIQRFHSHWTVKDIPRFGYEFSHFIKPDIDSTISERYHRSRLPWLDLAENRSLSAGTKLFYGSSTQCKSQFERLSELSVSGPQDIHEIIFEIVHR